MRHPLSRFIGMSFAAWLVLAGIGLVVWSSDRPSALLLSSVAFTICFIPTLATFVWSRWSQQRPAEQQLLAVLGGTGARMFFVLGVGLLLTLMLEAIRARMLQFWLWVLVMYLVTLLIEVVILVQASGSSLAKGD